MPLTGLTATPRERDEMTDGHRRAPLAPLAGELLDLAAAAATEAGRLLVTGRPADLKVECKSSETDAVTEMDRRSESLLTQILLKDRPQDAVLGEEGGSRSGTSGVRWVIDPLDGTVNYLYGLPAWSVSVAAEVAGTGVAGVVHAPVLGETYLGLAGEGAWLVDSSGQHRLLTGKQDQLRLALVATGFGYSLARRSAQARIVAQLLPRVRDIRRAGTASVDLCWLAAGRLDAYYESGIHDWDFAAAAVIAREAGAIVSGPDGLPPSRRLVMAANPALFPAFRDLLDELGAADMPLAD